MQEIVCLLFNQGICRLTRSPHSFVNDTAQANNQRLEQLLGIAALVLLLIGGFYILKPFVTAIMWSVILAFSLWPIQQLLTKWFRGRRTLASIVLALTMSLLFVGPIVLLGFGLADDAALLGSTTKRWVESLSDKPPTWASNIPVIGERVDDYWEQFSEGRKRWMEQIDKGMKEQPAKSAMVPPDAPNAAHDISAVPPAPALVEELNRQSTSVDSENKAIDDARIFETLGKLLGWARTWLVTVTLGVGKGMFQIGLSIILTFFLLRNGQSLGARVAVGASRIAGHHGQRLIKVAGGTVRGVVYGIIGTAVAQGVLAGFGFGLAGVPAAVLLGVLTFFLSAVPFGPPLVWTPATIWLFSQGRTGWGIFMLIWGMFIVSGVDNIIKPYLISHGSKIPFVLVFMGVIGGALAFGLVGVFLGPTLLAVAYRIVEEWSSVNALLSTTAPKQNEQNEVDVEVHINIDNVAIVEAREA